MKKVMIITSLLLLATVFTGNVYAAEEVVETTEIDWIELVTDFASLKNFLLSATGLSLLVALWKVRKFVKFIKNPENEDVVFGYLKKLLSHFSKSPELVIAFGQILVQMPIIKQLIDKAYSFLDKQEDALVDRILDLKAKLENKVYKNPEDIQLAQQRLAKLVAEYENIKPSQ